MCLSFMVWEEEICRQVIASPPSLLLVVMCREGGARQRDVVCVSYAYAVYVSIMYIYNPNPLGSKA